MSKREFSELTILAWFAGDEWTDCFTVKGISLPAAPYLGFSAMTGDVSDAHEYVSHLYISFLPTTLTNPPSV
jgi:mannose-binding lectin 2